MREIVSLVLSCQVACCQPQEPGARKLFRFVLYFTGVCTPCRLSSQILVMQFPHFLHAPTQIPKIWRRALVVGIPMPEKLLGDSKSYRPISLLLVPFQILDRLTYARVEPIIDSKISEEQAGVRYGKSTLDQITLLTQDIEHSFPAKKKGGAVFLNLTALYDTVWHCKRLRLLPDRNMVRMWVWQKKKSSTILSSSVQIINLPIDCTAWRLWIMWQSTGLSTVGGVLVRPNSGLKDLDQMMKKKSACNEKNISTNCSRQTVAFEDN